MILWFVEIIYVLRLGFIILEEHNPKNCNDICSDLKNWTKSLVPNYKPSEEETENILNGKVKIWPKNLFWIITN